MAKPIRFNDAGDTEDLQALFDHIAVEHRPLIETQAVAPETHADDELEALFDRATLTVAPLRATPAVQTDAPAAATPVTNGGDELETLFDGIAARQVNRAQTAAPPQTQPPTFTQSQLQPPPAPAFQPVQPAFASSTAQPVGQPPTSSAATAQNALPDLPSADAPPTTADTPDSAELDALFETNAKPIVSVAPRADSPSSPPPPAVQEEADNADLEALFEEASVKPPTPAIGINAQSASPVATDENVDNTDLEALFDAEAAQCAQPAPARTVVEQTGGSARQAGALGGDPIQAHQRLGVIVRQLHESLRTVGQDQSLDEAVKGIPDARERLAYIMRMVENSVHKALSAVEAADSVQDNLLAQSLNLSIRWRGLINNQLTVDEFKALAADTHNFFQAAPNDLAATSDQLKAILLVQNFQNLTGQVIKKALEAAATLESQLLKLLLETAPPGSAALPATAGSDGIVDSDHVDNLLNNLGF